jgi:hypothetical protein
MMRGRVFAIMGTAGLAGLSHCSLLFDTNALDDGGPATTHPDATTDGERLPGMGDDGGLDVPMPPDAAGDDQDLEAAGDDQELDAPAVGSDDTGALDVAGQDAGGLDAAGDAVDAPSDTGGPDAPQDSASDTRVPDAPVDSAGDTGPVDTGAPDAAPDGGPLSVGLVAFYPFDETSGTTSADVSGNGHNAMMAGATFSVGVQGNAATMSGAGQYVILPAGIVSTLASASISAWFSLNDTAINNRVFDFGTGTTTYMFLTPRQVRFGITTTGVNGEQNIIGPMTGATATWQHVAVTLAGATGTVYFNGVAVASNTAMTLKPSSLANTTANWLGRSQYTSDPYLNGKIDNFRIYNRALSAAEVQQLFTTKQ